MKKIALLLLVFLLIILIFGETTLALEPSEYYCENAFTDMVDYATQINNSAISDSEKVNYFSTSDKHYEKFYSYTLLNEKQLKLYNKIKNSSIGVVSVTVEYALGEFKVSELTKDFLTEIMNAVCHDLPQFFYHAGYRASYSYTETGYVTSIKYDFQFIEVKMSVNGNLITAVPTYSAETVASCWSEIENVLKQVDFDTTNRYNFVKSVHDYLCDNIIYPDFESEYYVGDCHDAYGALVNGYAVCQGYADAFKLICDRYNIPCVFISGTTEGGNHAWNAVQMDDGKWYFIDATWDDQEWKTFYEFFLIGTNTIDNGFTNSAFSSSHVNDENLFLPTLTYATEKYTENDHNTAFKATYNSLAKTEGNYLIRSFFDADESFVYYNGMYVDTNNLTTNGEFNISINNDTSEKWTLVLLGDCNGDGECNASDYSEAVNTVVSNDGISTAYDMAIDIDCDGYLDVLDLGAMQLLVNGYATEIEIE